MDTFDTGYAARRGTIFLFIVVFHVILIWALNSSLSRQVVERVFGPIETKIIEEIAEEKEEPPPPPPKIETPPPYVPPPDIQISLPSETAPTRAITAVTNKPKPPAPPPPPAVRKEPEIDPRFKRRFQPDYPPTSRRLGEEGSVILQVLVGPDGTVQDGKVQQSSGHTRLDEAALKHALRAWRFTPGTDGGKPITMWKTIKVTFQIK
jgi:protein TonB